MKKNYKVLFDGRGLMEEEIIESILNNRGIDDAEHFFNPTEEDLLPLDSLKNIDKAYEIVMKHINDNIGILFDTDTDGVSSGSIMTRYLRNYIDSEYIYPYINEGKSHGLIGQDLERFKDLKLLIIVDSLDKDVSQYKILKEHYGIDIIVLDHHAIDPNVNYSDYVTLVSSQNEYDNPQLSGAGVVWKFCKYIDSQELNDFADELTDLAATGIVADMMDMSVMENRYIVKEGLREIHNLAIKKIVGSYDFNSTAISFSVSPLINASNRLNKNEYAMNAFLSDDNKEVLKNINVLKKCKEQQNDEVTTLLPDAIHQCDEQINEKMIVVVLDTEHGINGLIGNKLLETYQRPILVLKDCGNKYMGSMRAVGVDDFRQMCNDSGLAIAKGHELSSGIEIDKENLSSFKKYINENLNELVISTDVLADVQLDVSDITSNLIYRIKSLDYISGNGFKPIKCYIRDINEYEVSDFSQKKHLVIKPNDSLMFIKWNYSGSFDDMEDNALMNEELEVCCTLDSGFIGRTFTLKGICDDITVVS